MAICAKCGATVPDGAPFCQACGASMGAAAPAPAPAPQQAAPQQAAPVQQYAARDPYDHTPEFDPRDISENKVYAMAPYLLGVFGIIIALLASNESKFARFHVTQSLKLQVTSILITFLAIIPILGWIAAGVCYIIIFVLEIIAFFNAAGGKAKEVPIIRGLPFLK